MDEYDPCDECHENGDDYYQDDEGDWMMRCYDCPLWDGAEKGETMDEVILSRITKEAYEKGYADGKVDGYNLAGKAISPQRKKGKWIECEDDTSFVKQLPRRWIECSECGASYDPGYKSRYLFCPRCGAEMVKGGDEPCTT